jgi:hypothetical protein
MHVEKKNDRIYLEKTRGKRFGNSELKVDIFSTVVILEICVHVKDKNSTWLVN